MAPTWRTGDFCRGVVAARAAVVDGSYLSWLDEEGLRDIGEMDVGIGQERCR